MECEVSYEELSRFASGELDEERAWQVQDHLRSCERCRRHEAALRALDGRLRQLRRIEPPAGAVLEARRTLSRQVRGGGPEVMTLGEVAEFLRVPQDALAEVMEELPAFELGGYVRVRRARLVEWIEQRERAYVRARAESEVAQILAGVN